MKKGLSAVLLAIASIAVAMVVAMPAGAAGNADSTQVAKFDPTGATFPCTNGTTYTVTGGTAVSIFHDGFDAVGAEHITGTTAPMGVTLSDGTTSTVYHLAGSSWFGGSFNETTGKFVTTDTAFFNIVGPSGGPVARVAAVEHFSSGGTNFSTTFGQCSEPQD
jgi:hypothetical protein